MKIKNVFDIIFSMDNLYGALEDASRGRRYQQDVLNFNYDAWTNLQDLRDEVLTGRYTIDRYYIFYIHEPKLRMIMSISFRHRVVQWAIYRVVNPMLVPGYIEDSYGCIPGRGALSAMKRLKYWVEGVADKQDQWYFLKLYIAPNIKEDSCEEDSRQEIVGSFVPHYRLQAYTLWIASWDETGGCSTGR